MAIFTSNWDLMLLAVGIMALVLWLAYNSGGLPSHTYPALQRMLIGGPAGLFGIFLLDHVVPKTSGWFTPIVFAVYGAVPLWLAFGDRKADAEWRRLNEAKTKKTQEEAERQRVLSQTTIQKDEQLAAENATYAPLSTPTASPTEITETARRIAEELRKR